MALARKQINRSSRPMNKVGARTRHSRKVWRKVKCYLASIGINSCEFRYLGCTPFDSLTPAHSKKRREFETEDDWAEIAIACTHCHKVLDEQMSHVEMLGAVRSAIANREQFRELNEEINQVPIEEFESYEGYTAL